ncbi:type I-G CRISPR-associated protein Csb2 [Arhodomonas sp. AD133]|uniref:type I-G CRISPR-associated protein Csb2 n=1 Tax=Arhodomonas sp. AD133 TaxID=3415009 RepID=UPI003EBE1E53
MLVVEVSFPGGRCYAASSHAPEEPEWPPHPSRLFSALVAAAGNGEGSLDQARPALEWLERQAPPMIQTPAADRSPAPTNYVPPADLNTQKQVVEHPLFRVRKPRQFPVAYPLGIPVVRYGWDTDAPASVVDMLDGLCGRLTHVGTSHSMAVARAYRGELNEPDFEPGTEGDEYFRVVAPGRLQELEALYHRKHPDVRRPPSGLEPLSGYRDLRRWTATASGPFDTVHILRLAHITHDLGSAKMLAAAMRTTVLEACKDSPPAAILGRSDRTHVAWLSLGDIGHRHARGRVLGMATALPRDMSEEDRLTFLQAMGTVQNEGLQLPDGRRVPVEPPDPERQPPVALMPATWIRPARQWTTATPVVPDRLPKRRNTDAYARAIGDSLSRAGYPEPEEIYVLSRPFWQGAPSIEAYNIRLPRFHALIRFPEPVQGPVIAGRLRYFGIGLFRPSEE